MTTGIAALVLMMVSAVTQNANMVEDSGFSQGLKSGAWHADDRGGSFETATVEGHTVLRYTEKGSDRPAHVDQVIAVEPGKYYRAAVFVRNDGTNLKPALRIADSDWQTLAYADVDDETTAVEGDSKWVRVETVYFSGEHKEIRFQLFGAGRDYRSEGRSGDVYFATPGMIEVTPDAWRKFTRARVTVDPSTVVAKVDPKFFGVNSLFWITDDAARADGKIAERLREMRCGLIRFPGGEVADNFHWKTNTLDDKKSFPFADGPAKLDFDEFIAWKNEIGAEAICVVNLESCFLTGDIEQGVKEAADWVRYSNIEKKYGVKYWEIGNETDLIGTRCPLSAAEYADAVVRFSKAMKAVDPTIEIGALGPRSSTAVVPLDLLTPDSRKKLRAMPRGQVKDSWRELPMLPQGEAEPWWPTVVETAGGHFDFAIVHKYDSSRHAFPEMFAQDLKLGQPIIELDTYFNEQFGREIPIALTEWNTWKNVQMNGCDHALTIAEQIGDYLSAGVAMANFWPMRYPAGREVEQFRSLLDYSSKEPRPVFYVMKAVAETVGSAMVASDCTSEHLYVFASSDEERGRVTVFLVNRLGRGDGVETSIVVPGYRSVKSSAVSLVSSGEGEVFAEQQVELNADAETVFCVLPPRSMTIVELQKSGE